MYAFHLHGQVWVWSKFFSEIDPSLYTELEVSNCSSCCWEGLDNAGLVEVVGTPARDGERDELRRSLSCDISMETCIGIGPCL